MAIAKIQRIPGAAKEIIDIAPGVIFSEFIKENDLGGFKFALNGIAVDDGAELDIPLADDDFIFAYNQPQGFVALAVIAIVAAFAASKFLVPKPKIPNGQGESKESPNNKLTGQTNIARLNQARPDVYGQVVSYPDLINESLFEYRGNEKFVTEWMNFGIGRYDVSRVRYSESPLTALSGSAYTIYNPGDVIPIINDGFEFADVDGQVLPGLNENQDNAVYSASTFPIVDAVGNFTSVSVTISRNPLGDPFDYFYTLDKPHPVSFEMWVAASPGSQGGGMRAFAGTLLSVETETPGNPPTYTFVVGNLSAAIIPGTVPPTGLAIDTPFTLYDNERFVVGPFFSPVPGNQLWVHLSADLGEGEYASCEISIYKVGLDNIEIPGTEQVFGASFPAAGITQTYFQTVKIAPAAGYGRYALRFKRLENSNASSILRIDEIHSVTVRYNVVHPKDTIITIEKRATKQPTSGSQNKFNAIINRHTISYNMTTRTVDYALRPTRSFADAVLHTWLIIGGQPESSIDAYELYSIAQSLPDQRLGYFDYTFDDADIALGARVEAICNAATVTAYWEDGILSFVRDQKQAFPVMLFNASNTLVDGYKVSYDMTLPGGFDGVDVQYVNPETNKYEHIFLAVVGDQVVKQQPNKASKIELAGCRDKYQAMDRAILECRRLIYSRITQSITAVRDGHSVSVGQLVRYSDTFDTNHQDGYIKSRVGNVFTTSERIVFDGNMYVTVSDYLGNPTEKVPAYPVPSNDFAFSAAVPDVELNLWGDGETQSPSRYIIAKQNVIDETLWVITEKNPSNDNTASSGGETASLTMAEYNSEMYDYENLLNSFMLG